MTRDDVEAIYEAKYNIWALEKLKNRMLTLRDFDKVWEIQQEIEEEKDRIKKKYMILL